MRKRNKFWRRFLLVSFVLLIFIGTITTACFYFLWQHETLNTEKLAALNQPATFYDQEQQQITTPLTKQFVTLDQINPQCVQAFIAVEDKNFYRHHGLSYPRIAKAVINNARAGYSKEGASTISQQLIKNTHLTNEKTMRRKIREAILALKLEQKYSKDEIITFYLNAIYFGNNLYGLASASEFYFQKTPAELSLAEGAGLAGIVKNPSKYDPIHHHDNFSARAHLVLRLMHEQNLITDDAYQTALNDPLAVTESTDQYLSSPYKSAALQEAAKILNLSESDIINYGYQIETYYDADKQKLLSEAMNEPTYNLAGEKLALLSKPNGQVNAFWTSNPTLLPARRNFGSALKPLLVYAPALELGIIQPDTKIDDNPLVDSDFNPRNADGQYHGLVTAREALAQSLNIPAVKILQATTIKQATNIAERFGLSFGDENISMALGNTSKGVTFFELAGGYQTIANGGKYSPVRFIRSIKDRNGQTVYFDLTNKYNYAPQAITADTAYLLTDMMLSVTQNGTGRKLSYLNTDIASKTGTTERTGSKTNTDATLISFTPENVLLTWHGNATMKPTDDLPSGANGGGKLANAAKQIHSVISKPNLHFTRPKSIQEVKLDAADYQAGDLRLASDFTPEHAIVTGLFARQYVPTQVSENYLVTTPTNLDGKLTANNQAQIWFPIVGHQTYEIYKNDVLQEVINGKSGEYIFTDKKLQPVNQYYIETHHDGRDRRRSETLTIRPDIATPPKTKAVERKTIPWYF